MCIRDSDGTNSIIEVMGGTFLATVDGEVGGGAGGAISADSSYINRLRNYDATTNPDIDLVVVQLSTNDSKGQCETGTVSDGFDPAGFDETTTVGSLEAITAYAKDTWGARVLVISGTQFEDEMTYSGGQNKEIYKLMIDRCHELEEKWGEDFTILDLWNNDAVYEGVVTGDALWRSYMSDAIHPTKKGYLEWWGPVSYTHLEDIEAELADARDQGSRSVTISLYAASKLLPELVMAFKREYPSIRLHIVQDDLGTRQRSECDLSIFSSIQPSPAGAENEVTLIEEEILLALPEANPFAQRDSVSLQEVAGEEFICLQRGKSLRTITDMYCKMAGFEPNVILESDSPETVRELIRAGIGISFIPCVTWIGIQTDHIALVPISFPCLLYTSRCV